MSPSLESYVRAILPRSIWHVPLSRDVRPRQSDLPLTRRNSVLRLPRTVIPTPGPPPLKKNSENPPWKETLKKIKCLVCLGLNTITLTVDIYSNTLREYSVLFTNTCESMSTGSSCVLTVPTWRCVSPWCIFLSVGSLLSITKRNVKLTDSPLENYKSSFYNVLSGRVTFHQILLLPRP